MKTMMELLIRLEQLRHAGQRTAHNPQLTEQERNTPLGLKILVRECLPPEVLTHYDQMKTTERELVSCPEVFAMAVLVSTYRDLQPRQRRKLVSHFATPAPAKPCAVPRNGTAKPSRGTARRSKAITSGAIGEPWPR